MCLSCLPPVVARYSLQIPNLGRSVLTWRRINDTVHKSQWRWRKAQLGYGPKADARPSPCTGGAPRA